MPHAHDHGDAHPHRRAANKRRLKITLLLVGAYMVAEIVGGLVANSLALLADAGHMLSDVAALGLSLFALWAAERPATSKQTYGFYRTEILAALTNGATLVGVSLVIFVEAYQRFRSPPEVQGWLVMAIATGGLVVNLLGLWILDGGRGESLNVRGAWLHMLGDALGSIGAIMAGLLIWGFAWYWVDPVISVVIAILVIYSSWRLLAESVSVLMESAPRGIDVDEVRTVLAATPGVLEVHDLHVWSITTGLDALSAHVVIEGSRDHASLLAKLRTTLHERFRIDHLTIQIEPEDFAERARCV